MALLRQTSFAAGALSPLLWGRTDLPHFAHGLRTLKNLLVTEQGSLVSRPGTVLLETCKTPDVILVPYSNSVGDGVPTNPSPKVWILELGHLYMRLHDPVTGYTAVEWTTVWRSEDLAELQWAQAGDTITFTHRKYAPYEFSGGWVGVSWTWTLEEVSYGPGFYPRFYDGVGGTWPIPALVDDPATTLFVLDVDHPPIEWRYRVSAVFKVNGYLYVESLAVDVTKYFNPTADPSSVFDMPADNRIVLGSERHARLEHPWPPGVPAYAGTPAPPTGFTNFVGLVWYRGRGDLFGKVGETRYATGFVDTGADPDYNIQPLRGDNPFATNENPRAVAFFQQRRVFGGSHTRPSALWMSATDEFDNFDRAKGGFIVADSPITMAILGRQLETIRSLVPHRRLLVFTDNGVWSIGGGEEGLAAGTEGSRLEDQLGATFLAPLVVDGAVLYVRAKGRGVRALALTDGGAYQATDITWQAEHLFRGDEQDITSWTFQRDPFSLIWAAQADGSILTCTRTGPSTWAWAKHVTGEDDGDVVKSIITVPSEARDTVYIAVKRGASTYIERLFDRGRPTDVPIPSDGDTGESAFAVDSAVLKVGAVGTAVTVTGLDHLNGREVWAVASGNAPQGPFTVVGGSITTEPFIKQNTNAQAAVLIYVGLPFTCDIETLDAVGAGRHQQKTVVSVGFEVDNAIGLEVGEDSDNLVAWQQRAVVDDYDAPSASSALVVCRVKGKWARTGRAFLRQAKPLPVAVLGISREVDTGGSQ